MAITLSIFNGCSKLFHCWKENKISNKNPYNTSYHTFIMLPHYLAKVRSSSFCIYGRKCRRKRNVLLFLNTHPIFMHLTYLLTYLLFQFPIAVKYFLKIADDFIKTNIVNWISIFGMFGMTLTRPPLTMQLTSNMYAGKRRTRIANDTR